MKWLANITDSMGKSLCKLWEIVKDGNLACCGPWGHKELGHNLATEQEQRIIFISKVFVYSKQKQVFNSIFKIKLLKDIFIFS